MEMADESWFSYNFLSTTASKPIFLWLSIILKLGKLEDSKTQKLYQLTTPSSDKKSVISIFKNIKIEQEKM